MTYQATIAVALVVICGGVLWYFAHYVRVWRRYTGERVVTCPETGFPAAVRIDASHAAMTALDEAGPEVRLTACSRWATRGSCEEPCIGEAQSSESVVGAIASRWYADKLCVYCRKPFGVEHWLDHPAALLASDLTTREWSSIPPEMLPEALRSDWPVCWNCHVAETFRRTHPELVIDRPSPRASE